MTRRPACNCGALQRSHRRRGRPPCEARRLTSFRTAPRYNTSGAGHDFPAVRHATVSLPTHSMSLSVLRRRLVACGVAAVLTACAGSGATSGPRVVCVSKQINEYLFDIHAESVLVARDLTSIYPPQITKLPSVGYHRALSAEGIVSMRPSMLLTDGNLGPTAVVEQVKKVGIPVVTLAPGAGQD